MRRDNWYRKCLRTAAAVVRHLLIQVIPSRSHERYIYIYIYLGTCMKEVTIQFRLGCFFDLPGQFVKYIDRLTDR